ncbi:MAG: glycosyltransferase family 4 protein, partial [Chromatiales bacterium]
MNGFVDMRVTLVGPLPPPWGGMANQTRQLASLLGKEGARVSVVQVNPPYRPEWIGRVRVIRSWFRLAPYLASLWRETRESHLMHVMANSGWSWHLFAAPAIWVASLRGVPVVVNYRGGEAEQFFQRSYRWVRPSLRRAAAVVVPSGFLQRVFSERGVPTRVVPNIIDLSRFSSTKGTSRDPSRPVIVVPRNLEPIYDIGTAIRAFALVSRRFPAARLIIAGSGPERARLERLATDLGVAQRTELTGGLDNERMVDMYREASVMLTPSLADNMPISILEALASGVPVVSTDVGGVPFMVRHEREALLVPRGDAAAMAHAIERLL